MLQEDHNKLIKKSIGQVHPLKTSNRYAHWLKREHQLKMGFCTITIILQTISDYITIYYLLLYINTKMRNFNTKSQICKRNKLKWVLNSGKSQLVLFDRSNITGAIDVKMHVTVLETLLQLNVLKRFRLHKLQQTVLRFVNRLNVLTAKDYFVNFVGHFYTGTNCFEISASVFSHAPYVKGQHQVLKFFFRFILKENCSRNSVFWSIIHQKQ